MLEMWDRRETAITYLLIEVFHYSLVLEVLEEPTALSKTTAFGMSDRVGALCYVRSTDGQIEHCKILSLPRLSFSLQWSSSR